MRRNPETLGRALEILLSLGKHDGEPKAYLDAAADLLAEVLGADQTLITVVHDGLERVIASNGRESDGHTASVHGLINEKVLNSGLPLAVEDARREPHHGSLPSRYRSYLGVPLRAAETVIGTACAFSREPRAFTPQDVEIAQRLGACVAQCLENNRILEMHRRLSDLGRAAATLVHELRSPLAVITLGLSTLEKQASPAAREHLAILKLEAERLDRLVRRTLDYARPLRLARRHLDPVQLAGGMLITLRELPEAAGKHLQILPPRNPVVVYGDPDLLTQALLNLVRNASEASDPGGRVRVSFEQDGTHLAIRVHNAQAIPREILARLPEPFLTTKESGTGLGLSLVDRIARAHGGRLRIASHPDHGTTIALWLPVAVH